VAGDATITGAPKGAVQATRFASRSPARQFHDNLSVDGTSTLKGALTATQGDSNSLRSPTLSLPQKHPRRHRQLLHLRHSGCDRLSQAAKATLKLTGHQRHRSQEHSPSRAALYSPALCCVTGATTLRGRSQAAEGDAKLIEVTNATSLRAPRSHRQLYTLWYSGCDRQLDLGTLGVTGAITGRQGDSELMEVTNALLSRAPRRHR
jgi:hypothetical protein